MGRLADLRNRRFEALVVCDEPPIRRATGNGKHRKNRVFWRCVCDCGNEKVTRAKNLVTGYTGSCGCLRGSPGKRKPVRNKQKYDYGNPALACFYSALICRAKRREIEFSISPAEFAELAHSVCFYCGEQYEYSFPYRSKGRYVYYKFTGCGLDRIDSNGGYTLDNVIPACKICNIAKQELSQSKFFRLVDKIYNRHCVLQKEV